MTVRVYVPATLEHLRAFVAAGSIPAGTERFTPDPAADQDEAEYAALLEAADASAAALGGPGRRVVLVAEVDDADDPVPMRLVRAVHADTHDVDPEDLDLPELAWYATQEIPDLLG